MPQLTDKQRAFLQNFLKVNGNQRKVNKQNQQIRESYEDYVRRRDKVKETIQSIKALKGGESRAISYERALQDIHAKVKAAAETGDETVIKASYKELETVKTDAYKTLEQREKELAQIGKDVAKFRQTLQEANNEGNDNKKTQKMQKLREECSKWLDKHSIDDCGVVWQIYQQAMRATGGPGPEDLLQGLKQLDGQFYELQKRFQALPEDAGEDDDEVEAVANMIRALRKQAIKYHQVAVAEEHKTGIAQTDRLLERLGTDFPLPGGVAVTDGHDQPIDDEISNEDLTDQPEISDDKLKTDEELEEELLQKADELVEKLEAEYERVSGLIDDVAQEVNAQVQAAEPVRVSLEEDVSVLTVSLAEARSSLADAKDFVDEARSIYDESAKDGSEQDWRAAVKDIGVQLKAGYIELARTERKIGTVEGNVYYVESLLASMQTLKTRLENLDEALVDTVMAKVALLPACNTVKAESDELDMVRQLTFVSGLDEGKIRSLLADASEDGDDKAKRKRLDKLIESFIKGPQLSTSEMTRMLMQASLIVIDAERFFGSPGTFKGTLDNDLKAKFDKVKNIAAQDLGKYTVPFTGTKPVDEDGNYAPQFESAGVAIVGGGPIGLMAAVESRLAGASLVNVYEGRSDPYSRMNVLTVDDSVARFKKNGVYEAIFPNGPGPKGHVASVKTIENALQARAESLGIELQREKFLENVEKDPKTGRTLLYFKGPEGAPPLECDLLILATGASVVSAKKHADNIALSDKLGINFSKSDVKDFAGVGYFDVDSEELPEGQERQPTDGWTYDFVTSEVKYLVTGLTEEEFNDYTLNPQKLVERLREDAEKVLLAKKESEFAKNEQGEDYQPLKFEIGIQQAQQFSTDDMGSVLVGDSAGTPHPSTGKGLNTGIAEMGAIHDLVKRVGTEHGQGPQDEETRKKAMQMYEAELKKRTNIVVDLGLNAIQDKSANHCTSFIRKFKRQVLDGVEGLGQLLGDNVMEKFTAHVNSLKTSVEDRKNDHDWKKREAGTKAIRAFEKQMQIVAQEIEALIAFQGLPQEDDQRQELGPAIVQKLRNLVPTV